jgi:hypothetical protein
MRSFIISALFVALFLISSPSLASAQSNVTGPRLPLISLPKLPLASRLLLLPGGAIEVDQTAKASRYADISVIQAPNVDTKMARKLPEKFASKMPVQEGWHACCQDFESTMMMPRIHHFVFGGLVQDAPDPEMLSHRMLNELSNTQNVRP